jgi:hypothetical protein
MPNSFDWDELTTPPTSGDVLEPFAVAYLVLFLLGFIAAAYLYYRPWTQPFGRWFRRRAVIRAANIAMWVFGTGLFFFLIRLLQIDPLTFGRPIWMWLSVLAVVALVILIALSWGRARADAEAGRDSARAGRRRAAGAGPTANRPVRRKSTLR